MIAFSLRGSHRAAVEAREQLAARDGLLPCSVRHVVPLLLTELVTNAVRHGGASTGERIEVTVVQSDRRLTVAVTDPGEGFEWRGRDPARPWTTGGFGLLLVDRLAQRWGIECEPDATTVWFELATDTVAATPPAMSAI